MNLARYASNVGADASIRDHSGGHLWVICVYFPVNLSNFRDIPMISVRKWMSFDDFTAKTTGFDDFVPNLNEFRRKERILLNCV